MLVERQRNTFFCLNIAGLFASLISQKVSAVSVCLAAKSGNDVEAMPHYPNWRGVLVLQLNRSSAQPSRQPDNPWSSPTLSGCIQQRLNSWVNSCLKHFLLCFNHFMLNYHESFKNNQLKATKNCKKKSPIREIPTLSTDADSRTDIYWKRLRDLYLKKNI